MLPTPGTAYDWQKMEFLGWANGQSYPGLKLADFFDQNGIYLGPTLDGVEPEFAD
jgi:hypothetical protein